MHSGFHWYFSAWHSYFSHAVAATDALVFVLTSTDGVAYGIATSAAIASLQARNPIGKELAVSKTGILPPSARIFGVANWGIDRWTAITTCQALDGWTSHGIGDTFATSKASVSPSSTSCNLTDIFLFVWATWTGAIGWGTGSELLGTGASRNTSILPSLAWTVKIANRIVTGRTSVGQAFLEGSPVQILGDGLQPLRLVALFVGGYSVALGETGVVEISSTLGTNTIIVSRALAGLEFGLVSSHHSLLVASGTLGKTGSGDSSAIGIALIVPIAIVVVPHTCHCVFAIAICWLEHAMNLWNIL